VSGSLDSPKSPSPESWRRLVDARVARLATHNPNGAIDLVPFTFAVLDDRTIVSAVDHKPKRTRQLRRLANIRANPKVTVLADHYEEDWSKLWWVRARGDAVVLDRPPEAVLAALVAKYEQYGAQPPAGPAIVIAVTELRGWSSGG
jgi:PPOX class probable F420-dependent enzyme